MIKEGTTKAVNDKMLITAFAESDIVLKNSDSQLIFAKICGQKIANAQQAENNHKTNKITGNTVRPLEIRFI